jgi:hypothetical protein
VTGVLDRGDYRIEKIIFESRPAFYVTANVYLPKAGGPPYTAILYPLGHERGAKAHQAWQRPALHGPQPDEPQGSRSAQCADH